MNKKKNAPKRNTRADKKEKTPKQQNRLSTRTKKKAMLLYLEKTFGVVTVAAKHAKVNPKTHYEWLQKDAKYKAAVDMIDISQKDFGENMLHQKMAAGDTATIIFYNKTKNKDRGYAERHELTGPGGKPLIPAKRQVMIIMGREVEF